MERREFLGWAGVGLLASCLALAIAACSSQQTTDSGETSVSQEPPEDVAAVPNTEGFLAVGSVNQLQQDGYLGCVACHQGMLIGGNMYQKVGVFGDYFADRGNLIKSDLGRYNVTNDDRDRHVFKVPSLRNITLTSPYFHFSIFNSSKSICSV